MYRLLLLLVDSHKTISSATHNQEHKGNTSIIIPFRASSKPQYMANQTIGDFSNTFIYDNQQSPCSQDGIDPANSFSVSDKKYSSYYHKKGYQPLFPNSKGANSSSNHIPVKGFLTPNPTLAIDISSFDQHIEKENDTSLEDSSFQTDSQTIISLHLPPHKDSSELSKTNNNDFNTQTSFPKKRCSSISYSSKANQEDIIKHSSSELSLAFNDATQNTPLYENVVIPKSTLTSSSNKNNLHHSMHLSSNSLSAPPLNSILPGMPSVSYLHSSL